MERLDFRPRRDLLTLVGILVLAALTRFPGLALRGQWDADQGNELLVLLHWVRDGQLPLVGPSTFAGSFHHGALYYYILAPAAFLSDVDPNAIVLTLALLGLATVAVVWGLGFAIGGVWTGHLAGLLAAVSPSFILGSTFIWNPNLVPLGSGVALLAAVMAWTRRSPWWWVITAVGAMVAMQLHVSGALLVPPLLAAWALDARRQHDRGRMRVIAAGAVGAGVILMGYVPLIVHELQAGFADTRGLIGYITTGAGSGGGDLVVRLIVVFLRSVTWPFVGVVTEAPMAAAAVLLVVVTLGVLAVRLTSGSVRSALMLMVGVFGWSVPALAISAPTLLTSVPGLPNDHYHAYLDPLVIVVAAAGLVAVAGRVGRDSDRSAAAGQYVRRAVALGVVAALVAVSVARWPAATSPDGGWPMADRAAADLLRANDAGRMALVSLPSAKTADAIRFPLERRGTRPVEASPSVDGGQGLIIVCDPLFESLIGSSCAGDAQRAYASSLGWDGPPVNLFAAGSRRIIAVFSAR